MAGKESEGKKKTNVFNPIQVPVDLYEVEESIYISTNKPSKEEIINHAFKYHSEGNISRAKKYYQYFLKEGFDDPKVFSNYGVLLKGIGKLKEAEIILRKAIQINPDYANAYSNLGNVLKDLGKLKEAEFSQRKAIEINPNFANAYSNLGMILKELGNLREAEESLRKANKINPNCINTKLHLEDITQKLVPRWHIPMMNDYARNSAYLKGINLAIKENDYVLDIGSGSGLLSMMAIDAGAKKVITCESNESISKVANTIISKNGYQDKIKVINIKSTNLTIKKHLKKKVDVIISEIFSSELVGEGIQPSLLDAKQRLLKENGKMIPESGEIKFALLERNSEVEDQCLTSKVNGYDLSEFNKITGNKFIINIKNVDISFLSNELIAFFFDFYFNSNTSTKELIIDIPVVKSGICLGIITWIKVNVYQNISLENKPNHSQKSHWNNPIYRFKKPLIVKKGNILKVKASLIDDNIWFELVE